MRRPVRALYRILMYTAFLVSGTEASDDSHTLVMDLDSEESVSSIHNRDMNSPIEHIDNSLCSSASFVLTQTEGIEYYPCSSSNSTKLYDHNSDHPMENTKQTNKLSYLQSTHCNLGTEQSSAYCPLNVPEQEYAEDLRSLSNYKQPIGIKRPGQHIEENASSKKQANKNTISGLNIDCANNSILGSSKTIRSIINNWVNIRLKNKHRKIQHTCYIPIIKYYQAINSKYVQQIDKNKLKIEAYIRTCKDAYSIIPINNELWFVIASRSTCMHTKLADCKDMDKYPSNYKCIKGLNDYYSDLPGDIVRYMDKYGPIVSDQIKIKTKWTETIGDIYVREPVVKSEYEIGKEITIRKDNNKYSPVAIAIQMILGLPEIHKDLSNLSIKFISSTLKGISLKQLAVVKSLHEIVAKHKKSKKPELYEEYAVISNIFTNILHQTDVLHESIVIQLYTEIYKSIIYFYEKAEVCEEIVYSKRKKKLYLLTGKCIIKPQRYLKCTTDVYLNKPASKYKHVITEEANKWTIPSNIEKHYHIHYVDNTKQQYTRVCMSMCSDKYIHTISQIIEYLKRLYNIGKNKCICPYKRSSSGDWEYIQEEERDKTVQEFAYYDIVFYYIEEGIRDGYFTFSEFKSYKKPRGTTVRIPLFLSPLMRSAIRMGPFEERDKIKHKLVDSMQSMRLQPSVYIYEEKYKAKEYSYVHYYYSNLYIQRDNADVPAIDCYIMDSKTIISNNTATVEWYAKIRNSVDEYTHCIFKDELINDQQKYNAFRKAIISQEYTPDSEFYGFGLQSSIEKTSKLDGVGCSTDYPIGYKDIADCKISIMPIYKISATPKIADLQSKIDKLNKKHIRINIMIKKPETTKEQKKELKRRRNALCVKKHYNIQRVEKMQLHIKEESVVSSFPSCAFFIVFRCSNTHTKSSLGAHNEILDALTRRYNISKKYI